MRLLQASFGEPFDISASADSLCADEEGVESDLTGKCELRTVKNGELMAISDQIDFEFIRTATPRWPDMMAIYVPQRKVLFSSKLFSAHVVSQLAEFKAEKVFKDLFHILGA